jgi:hypothetical protein
VLPISASLSEHIRHLVAQQRLGHGYILHGPAKGFPSQACIYIALATLCHAQPPCLHCSTCQRILNHDHPDIRVLSGDSTPVDAIRQVVKDIQLGARQGHRLFVCVLHADQMTPQAANAFLKTLEEPPSGVTIILATESLEKLLPTIRSRCTSLACPNVTDSDIRQWISEKTGTPYEGLISHAMISYIEKTGHFPHDIVTLETIQGYTTSDKLQLAENLAKDKFLAKLAMQQWLEECVAAATTTVSPTQANQTAQILLTHIKNSHYNLNTRLQLEALLFGLNA